MWGIISIITARGRGPILLAWWVEGLELPNTLEVPVIAIKSAEAEKLALDRMNTVIPCSLN